MYQKMSSSWGKHIDFILLDIICIQLSYLFAYGFNENGHLVYADKVYLQLIIITCLLHIVVSFLMENYSNILRRGVIIELKSTFGITSIVFACVLVYLFISKQSSAVSRAVLISTWVINSILSYVVRLARKKYIKSKIKQGNRNVRMVLLVATSERMPFVITQLEKNSFNDCKIAGCVLLDREDLIGEALDGVSVVIGLSQLDNFILNNVVDEALIDEPDENHNFEEKITDIAELLISAGVTVHYNLLHKPFHSYHDTKVEKFYGYTVLSCSIKMATQRQLFVKRCMDIVGGLIGCILCGIAFLFVAPMIKKQSPGPVFFSQVRVGRNGRKFKIYKFRSMYMDAEERKKELMAQNKMDGFMFKMDNDPRIFPFGKFLRETSLDEFPQFFNVLKGDMSLVGTRPPTLDEVKKYDLRHKSRLASKPGITGMWQVSGRSNITDFEEVVRLDNEYLENWSIGLDIKILFKTILMVLKREGSE